MTKYFGIVWKDRTHSPSKKRRFSFTIYDIPEKFRMTTNMIYVWARYKLSKKYGIPNNKIDIFSFCRKATRAQRDQFFEKAS
jgi:hypothetical protein